MKQLMLLFCMGAGLLLTACNTVQGLGKDIEATGEAIENTANEVKQKL